MTREVLACWDSSGTPVSDERTSSPPPRAYGADRVEAAGEGGYWLVSPAPKGWVPRKGREHTSSEYPGTAVRWDEELYEVVDAAAQPDGKVRYRLERWPDRHTVRAIQTYDSASDARRERVRAEHGRNISRRRLSILFSPLLGHLPAAVQEKMESEFGAPAIAMTVVSALPLLVVGFVSFLYSLAAAYGAGYSAAGVSGLENASSRIPHLLPLPLAVYLTVESFLRLAGCFVLGRPFGSLPGTLFYEGWRIALGLPPPPALSVRGAPPTSEQALQDRFRMFEALLGLLSTEEQERLELRFGMETLRWTRITALLLLALGGLNVVASAANLAAGIGRFRDVLWLLAGAAITVEQIARLREAARGHPSGSVLGALVRPLARDLLRPRP